MRMHSGEFNASAVSAMSVRTALKTLGLEPRSQPVGVSVRDETVGGLLRGMRTLAGIDTATLALRLGTTTSVIGALEAGELGELPDLIETERILTAYGHVLDIDTGPICARLRNQLRAVEASRRQRAAEATVRVQSTEPKSTPVGQVPAKAQTGEVSGVAGQAVKAKRRVMAAVALGLMALLGVFVATDTAYSPLRAAVSVLPSPLARPLQAGLDRMAEMLAPRREGLKWIDVSDPRSRKADRLAVSGQRL